MTAPLTATIESSLLTKRGINEIQRVANRVSGLEMRNNLGQRFKGPRRGQTHKRRSASWNKKKRQEVGHILPLVYRGNMRRAVLTKARVTATSKQGRVITTTGARGFRTSEWRRLVKQEIEQVPRPEEVALAKSQKKTIVALASNRKYHKRQRRRIK